MSFELKGRAKNMKHLWEAILFSECFNDVTNYNTANMWAVNIINSFCGSLLSFACHLKRVFHARVVTKICYRSLANHASCLANASY